MENDRLKPSGDVVDSCQSCIATTVDSDLLAI